MHDHDQTPESPSETNRGSGSAASMVASFFDEWTKDPGAVERLEELLRTDDHALRLYVEMADLDARLRWINRGALRTSSDPVTLRRDDKRRTIRAVAKRQPHSATTNGPAWSAVTGSRLLRSRAAFVTLAASLLLVLATGYYFHAASGIGRLTETAAVKWGDPTVALAKGSRIDAGALELLEGVIEITLHNDTRLIIEGPAAIHIRSDMEAFLEVGTVSVFVGNAVDGFTLDCPDVRVVDLGTAFQMTVSSQGADVHVIDGEVVAFAKGTSADAASAAKTHLGEREALRFNHADGSIRKIDFAGGRMKLRGRDVPLTAIPIAVTGDIRCLDLPPESVALGDLEDDDRMHLFLERSDCTVSRPIYADRNSRGQVARDLGGNVKLKIPTGRSLNSYLLHYDTENDFRDYTLHRVSGTITFRTPILAVFTSGVGLRTSDRAFRCDSTKYVGERHPLGNRGLEDLDFVSFSPDRKTLIVNFQANTGADQLRIITMREEAK